MKDEASVLPVVWKSISGAEASSSTYFLMPYLRFKKAVERLPSIHIKGGELCVRYQSPLEPNTGLELADGDECDLLSPCPFHAVKAAGFGRIFGVGKSDGVGGAHTFKGRFWKVIGPSDEVIRILYLVGPSNSSLPV